MFKITVLSLELYSAGNGTVVITVKDDEIILP